MVTVRADGFEESQAAYWLRGTDKDGSYNDAALADINGDGKCDFLAAIEAEKEGSASSDYTAVTTNDRIASYVVFNENGSFSGESLDLPNPYFGENTAAFSIGRFSSTTNASSRSPRRNFGVIIFRSASSYFSCLPIAADSSSN